jgi:hypothetical protein
MTDDDEIVKCYQCDWPIRRAEGWVVVIDVCPDCGQQHEMGVAHIDVCAMDLARGESRALTQKRKRGKQGVN